MLNVSKFQSLSALAIAAQKNVDNTAIVHADAQAAVAEAITAANGTAVDHADAVTNLRSFISEVKAEIRIVEKALRRSGIKAQLKRLIDGLFKR